MTTQVFRNVSPILAGYDSTIRIKFSQQAWDVLELGTGRLISHFRSEIEDEEPLFVADSEADSIMRDTNTVSIIIPGLTTKNWEVRAVYFDMARLDGTSKKAIPGIWRWPVRKRVTRDV